MAISVIIPAAEMPIKRKKNIPISLLDIGNRKLIERQIAYLRRFLSRKTKRYEIILVGGYKFEVLNNYVSKNIPGITLVENFKYSEDNKAKSVRLGLLYSKFRNIMVVDGTTLMKGKVFPKDLKKSFLITDEIENNGEIGVLQNGPQIINLFYGHNPKWCEISYFTRKESKMLDRLLENHYNDKKFMFEIINDVISMGGQFQTTDVEGHCVNINSYATFRYANNYLFGEKS